MHKCVDFPLCHNKKTPGKFRPWSLIFAQLVFIKLIHKIILPYLEFACKYFLYIICFKYSIYDFKHFSYCSGFHIPFPCFFRISSDLDIIFLSGTQFCNFAECFCALLHFLLLPFHPHQIQNVRILSMF